jgi:GNAT superfamily N-acetyltransferase
LHRLSADDWPRWRPLRLDALRDAPYAFAATLEEWQGAGDTPARWRERLASVPLNLVASLDGIDAGMASGIHLGIEVGLISMWVAPFARGLGVGAALIQGVIDWASGLCATSVVLDVRTANSHAIALYLRHGFIDAGPVQDALSGAPPERRMIRSPVARTQGSTD